MGIYNGFERGSTNQNQAPELTVFIKSVLQSECNRLNAEVHVHYDVLFFKDIYYYFCTTFCKAIAKQT